MVTAQYRTRAAGVARIQSRLGKTLAVIFAFGVAPTAWAQGISTPGMAPASASAWSFGEVFTFLFVTLGPLNVIGPFLMMTEQRSAAFNRRVALKSFVFALAGLLVAATIGAATLHAWGISIGALLATGGAILLLVALRPVLAGYLPRVPPLQPSAAAAVPARSTELALTPLAFPTIITPYGLALLVLLFTLHPLQSGGLWVLGTAVLVLALNLLVMLCAGGVAKIPLINLGLDILGCVMNVLLIALGVQAVADGVGMIAEQRF